jgi:ornithine cyclodeaminase
LVYDTNPRVAEAFVEEMQDRGKPIPSDISAVSTPEKAVSEADVICTATTSSSPVFDDTHLKSGVHINGIGSYTPEMQEIPEKTVMRARIVVDSLTASLEEAGDIIIPIKKGMISQSHIRGELGHVALAHLTIRESEEDITFFKSVGLAIQDVAVAKLAVQRADDLRLGTDLDL